MENFKSQEKYEHRACMAVQGACCLLLAGFLLNTLFDPEDAGDTFLQNVRGLLPDYTALKSRRLYSSQFAL
jgi:hypothetical protein